MSARLLAHAVLLPELKLLNIAHSTERACLDLFVKTKPPGQGCPKCANYCDVVYDHRVVRIRDEPLRTRHVTLHIRKRRFFCHTCKYGGTQFVSLVADYSSKRVLELVEGKTVEQLHTGLRHIRGRENVQYVAMDLCDPFKSFVRAFFPNATIVADKFHVLRLLNPGINRERKAITGDRRTLKVRRLLLRSRRKMLPLERHLLDRWLESYPTLREIYNYKEALHRFYRIRGQKRAAQALTAMTDAMATSKVPEIKTLRRTLMKWREAILAYFKCRLTNGRTEGLNNLAKRVKRNAFSYRSFRNDPMRLLHASAFS